ncbi:hypothetical protein ABZ401_11780 [Streptomyces sp. NPDC005892]|uniref:hypothetical protein n=1 Tax=Streptomyces sp. NPDC005892 TaxID=3155593 RepID=UPI0033FB5AAE
MTVDQQSWEAAVHHLYRDAYAYIATGPRRHDDWTLDVVAVMARAVTDPRGWTGQDDAAEDPARRGDPKYPFADHSPEYIAPRLHEIDRASAENLLLALTEDGCTLSNLRYFDESPDELHAMARSILARYGDDATFHTNVHKPDTARGTLDFTTTSRSYSPLSVYSEDSGLVVVADTEMGMFWNFADY